jgi:cell division protein FtsL
VARLNLLLLVLLTVCALGLVTSQHKARKLFADLEREQARTKALEVERGQLELETRTWALPSRISALARERLGMSAPDARQVHILPLDRAARAKGTP